MICLALKVNTKEINFSLYLSLCNFCQIIIFLLDSFLSLKSYLLDFDCGFVVVALKNIPYNMIRVKGINKECLGYWITEGEISKFNRRKFRSFQRDKSMWEIPTWRIFLHYLFIFTMYSSNFVEKISSFHRKDIFKKGRNLWKYS